MNSDAGEVIKEMRSRMSSCGQVSDGPVYGGELIDWANRLEAALAQQPVGVELLCQVYADAYHAGHHATVEGGYIDVLPVDRDTYWREKVEEDYPEAIAQQPVAEYQRVQPCGCVLCVCEDEKRCHGCGAKHCGNRTDHPAYVEQQPAAVDTTRVALAAANLLAVMYPKRPRPPGPDRDAINELHDALAQQPAADTVTVQQEVRNDPHIYGMIREALSGKKGWHSFTAKVKVEEGVAFLHSSQITEIQDGL